MRKSYARYAHSEFVKLKFKPINSTEEKEFVGTLQNLRHNAGTRTLDGAIHDSKTGRLEWFNIPEDAVCTVYSASEIMRLAKKDKAAVVRTLAIYHPMIGSDPEIFIVDKMTDIVIPAFKFLPDKKTASKGDRIFWDGFQAEFTTPPMGCLAYLTDDVRMRLSTLSTYARQYNPNAKFTYKSVVDIPMDVLMNAKMEHVQLGCAPSLNVYGHEPLNVPDPYQLNVRSAGYHMHFEEKCPVEERQRMVMCLDKMIGVLSVCAFQGIEDTRRRIFYGRAGEYRLPAHGLEYRVLSSAVLIHPVIHHLFFDLARGSLATARVKPLHNLWEASKDEVIQAINFYDVGLAKRILERNKSVLVALLTRIYPNQHRTCTTSVTDKVNKIVDVFQSGVVNHFDINNIEGNWRIGKTWDGHCQSRDCSVYSWKVE